MSIANNLLMYNKCYISRNLPTYDPRLKSTIGFLPINLYYPYGNGNQDMINEVKSVLSQIQNKTKLYVTYGPPTFDDYVKINEIDNSQNLVISEESQ